MTHTYSFGSESNSYFNGRDEVITRDDDARIKVNIKDGMWAVNVKAHAIASTMPADVQNAISNLPDSVLQVAEDQAREGWWIAVQEIAVSHGFDKVYSAGRSGGWMAVNGTQDWHPNELFEPEEDDDSIERFLALAFDAVASIESAREDFYYRVREAFGELQLELRDASDWVGAAVSSLDGDRFTVERLAVRDGRPVFMEKEPATDYSFAGEVTLWAKGVSNLPYGECPGCGKMAQSAQPGHRTGCVIGALLTVMEDRGFDFAGTDISDIDASAWWDSTFGPAVDAMENELRGTG